MKEPIFIYNEEEKTIVCYIEDKDMVYFGTAKCHPEDAEFFSQRTGENIAASRAYIEYLNGLRDTIKIELNAFKHLYSCMKTSKKFNKKSYETKMISKTIQKLEQELTTVKSDLKSEKRNLNDFLNNKNTLYRKVEALRANQSKESTKNSK